MPCVQVGNGKAEFVLSPDQISIFQPILHEAVRFEILLNLWVDRACQKWCEVDLSHIAIAKGESQPISVDVFGSSDFQEKLRWPCQRIRRVIVSGETRRCRMK